MVAFRESRTAKNLLISYAFESQATTRYTFFADQAAREGYIQFAGIFRETAGQECEHALRFFKFFNGGELEVTASFLTGVVKDTKANLVAAAELEKYVHSSLYPGFAQVAREEGLVRAADVWDAISVAEVRHEETFRELAENMATNRAFRRESSCTWRCINCGYIHQGSEAPEKCPACVRPSNYFEVFDPKY
ncbi:rubrerythrin [Desulfosarcina widdelii]|uniref:Rubrerythrin n=1 Tax=Desulfosarcina widdelii TaxID=947919 RepID=A0A5K7ZAM3_9BACT|nr:rubrerythrin family protein [Desulfosarcina widdelii]BBO78128.1 rubrerythrin [Desulfosarcina widdelii]